MRIICDPDMKMAVCRGNSSQLSLLSKPYTGPQIDEFSLDSSRPVVLGRDNALNETEGNKRS
jgi:hypothetical protein